MRANNNKGGEFVKKADNPVVIVNGNNNDVELKVIDIEIPPKTLAIVIVAVAILAVSLCCPELLADFVRWIISGAIGS
jgi:hypothetical protein